jgi:hypothetical protein
LGRGDRFLVPLFSVLVLEYYANMVEREMLKGEDCVMTTIITILIIAAILCSIFAWINTKIILEELASIKEHLGIKEEESKSFSDKGADHEL